MSHPFLPDKIIKTHPLMYYRFHGVPQLYASPYDRKDLKEVVKKIKLKKATAAFAYFNNDINAAAVSNAQEMKELV